MDIKRGKAYIEKYIKLIYKNTWTRTLKHELLLQLSYKEDQADSEHQAQKSHSRRSSEETVAPESKRRRAESYSEAAHNH